MFGKRLHVVQVNTQDVGGGAESIARNLHAACRGRGCLSHFAVGRRYGDDPHTLQIPNGDELKSRRRLAAWFAGRYPPPENALGQRNSRLVQLARWLAWPIVDGTRRLRRACTKMLGREDFDFPGTWRLPELAGVTPDVFHLHNLHGGYFDLRALPWLSRRVSVMLTLHDAWAFSGHCAHSLGCNRWKTGCGACPDLSIYPRVKRDATARNWRRKRDIFARSRLYLAAPSKWLIDCAKQSMLWPGVVEARVIPNGIDLSIFQPGDRYKTRWRLGLPSDADVLTFAANGLRSNSFKDYDTLRRSLEILGRTERQRPLVMIALGEQGPTEKLGSAEIRHVALIRNPALLADYYRASDLYLHAARAESFGLTIAEAMACGTPVVATAVGGIPEVVSSLPLLDVPRCRKLIDGGVRFASADTASGMLVPPADAEGMADAVAKLLEDKALHQRLAENAARDARRRFSREQHVDTYLAWYQELAGAHAGAQTRRAA